MSHHIGNRNNKQFYKTWETTFQSCHLRKYSPKKSCIEMVDSDIWISIKMRVDYHSNYNTFYHPWFIRVYNSQKTCILFVWFENECSFFWVTHLINPSMLATPFWLIQIFSVWIRWDHLPISRFPSISKWRHWVNNLRSEVFDNIWHW